MNLQTDLLVLLPELILAVGAMALLLAGAIGGEKTAPAISWGAIVLLVVSGVGHRCWARRITPRAFHGAFVADGFRPLRQDPDPDRRGAFHPAGR